MPRAWPSLDELLDGACAYRIPLRVPFRGLTEREGLLVNGPSGWGEFAPFADYDDDADVRWLSAALEAAWGDWAQPRRDVIAVNAIVPAVAAARARELVAESGCTTVKVKVADAGQTVDDDVVRVGAVRDALGSGGRIRIDANGAWTAAEATECLKLLAEFDLEYVEQPCASLGECAELRRHVDVPIALDEGIRRAPDPRAVAGVAEAADLIVLKAAPLGGVSGALHVALTYGLPVVVSSALESSIGLSAGVALAAALPDLPYACGLGTGQLLAADVTHTPVVPRGGVVSVQRVAVDPAALDPLRAPADVQRQWRDRATVAYRRGVRL